MNRIVNFLTLFASMSTLLCCALPALLVSIGLGAVMAGLATNIPGLIWVSEYKAMVFGVAGVLLIGNGIWLWLGRNLPCPTEPSLRDACLSGRKISRNIYLLSLGAYLTGFFFAYLAAKI